MTRIETMNMDKIRCTLTYYVNEDSTENFMGKRKANVLVVVAARIPGSRIDD